MSHDTYMDAQYDRQFDRHRWKVVNRPMYRMQHLAAERRDANLMKVFEDMRIAGMSPADRVKYYDSVMALAYHFKWKKALP